LEYHWQNSILHFSLVEYTGVCYRADVAYEFVSEGKLPYIFNFAEECVIKWHQSAADNIDEFRSQVVFECPGCWQQCVHSIKRGLVLYHPFIADKP
jgi:hypothetical protein